MQLGKVTRRTTRIYCGELLPSSWLFLLAAFTLLVGKVEPNTRPKLTDKQMHRTVERVIEHHSFTPPLLRNYFVGDGLEHWSIGGSAVITDDHVRLTGDFKDQEGYVWNKEALDIPSFETIVGFHLHGSGRHPADGFGVWIVSTPPSATGPLMGHPMDFEGVGVLFDTYDNDNRGNNPSVYVLHNAEGSKKREYTPTNDFENEHVGTCNFAFRQTSTKLSTVRLHYKGGTLQVYLSSSAEEDEQLCTSVPVELNINDKDYYIVITAATGGSSDNHDIAFVHTMPVEGETYDHDVYSRTTPVEESAKHHQSETGGEAPKSEEADKSQTVQQEGTPSTESANETGNETCEVQDEEGDKDKQHEKTNEEKSHEPDQPDSKRNQGVDERQENKEEEDYKPPPARRTQKPDNSKQKGRKGKGGSGSKKRSVDSTPEDSDVVESEEEEQPKKLDREAARTKGRRIPKRKSRHTEDVDHDQDEDGSSNEESEFEDDYQDDDEEEEDREDNVRRRRGSRQRSPPANKNRKRRSKGRR